jgi:hypothetical protein
MLKSHVTLLKTLLKTAYFITKSLFKRIKEILLQLNPLLLKRE